MADENLLPVCYNQICDRKLTYDTIVRLGCVRSYLRVQKVAGSKLWPQSGYLEYFYSCPWSL